MVCAGIAIYNPERNRLLANIKNLLNQVELVVCYNNGCENDLLEILRQKFGNRILLIGDGENRGIAHALNCMMEMVEKKHFDWMITMDQDSILPEAFMQEIQKRNIEEDIAIICPQIMDKQRIYMRSDTSTEEEYIEKCITSASFTRVDAWKKIGGFDEFLFIDLVDFDFCIRLRAAGYKILKLNKIILDHKFGDIELKSKKVVAFYQKIYDIIPDKNLAANISKLSYRKKVSPMRIYYTNRNILYLNKKLKNYGGIGYECYHSKTYFGYAVFYNLASVLRGKEKRKIMKAIGKGMIDGYCCKVEPLKVRKIYENGSLLLDHNSRRS